MGSDKARAGCTKQGDKEEIWRRSGGDKQEIRRRCLLLGRRWNSACAATAVPGPGKRQEDYPWEFSSHVFTTAVMESSKTQVPRRTFFPPYFFLIFLTFYWAAEQSLMVVTIWEFMGENWGRPTRQISWWEPAIDHPTRMERWMKYSIKSWEDSHHPYPFFSWGTSTSQNSAKETQQRNSGVSLFSQVIHTCFPFSSKGIRVQMMFIPCSPDHDWNTVLKNWSDLSFSVFGPLDFFSSVCTV